jgi:mannose-6-phosphate isomerase-like protein (cupin superfamily)
MQIRKLTDFPEILAGDHTRLRELLHPDRGYSFEGRYSLAHAEIEPGRSSAPHRLKSSEVYYVLSGEGEMHVNADTALICSGDAVIIPAGSVQWVNNTGGVPLVFLCIVDPAWRPEDEDVLE